MTLNLYLVNRGESGGVYDEYHGHVVAADDETEARTFAGRVAADEGAQIWHEGTTTVRQIGVASADMVAGIVLSDFHAG